ncbi:mycothiol system anti-sigma-R factor [Spiractinospora alimapuensis]|uniref:mycothiol system anti-sigma-R factor n=1 Tax=Spiractinospora alimapuensis TaxID=2820884 RepID=UPI001EEA9F30|nr:mycothiol system anti-sigma-R factor [Spiractinospora alimapuensis]QVQ54114.1 mycothiol system anti-sigma-R factor [Spiractinospora alimapuensis]
MSCEGPSDTPCSEVLAKVYAYLDGELEEGGCAEIREHLDQCEPCLREYGLDEAVKRLVARCCGRDPVPPGLRDKVLTRLASAEVEERGRTV